MPWEGVTVSEQKQRFIEDYLLNYYTITDLAQRFNISRRTAYTHPEHQGKWINRYLEQARLDSKSNRGGHTAAHGRPTPTWQPRSWR
jgi:predicted DNA-binding protein YlxM (UPF0122 family)